MSVARFTAILILLTAALPAAPDTLLPERFPYVTPHSEAAAQRNRAALKAVAGAIARLGFCPSVTSLGLLLIAGLLVAGLEMTERREPKAEGG